MTEDAAVPLLIIFRCFLVRPEEPGENQRIAVSGKRKSDDDHKDFHDREQIQKTHEEQLDQQQCKGIHRI